MKAVVYERYGSPDVLEQVEMEKPVPKDNEVLIKIRATSVNASDWELLRGKPAYARIWGLFKPKIGILGSDISGSIEAVGRDVKRFRPGDAVFGDIFERWGGFAEYVCTPEEALVPKPDAMSFEEAAALPQAAVIALQGIRDKGNVQPGQKVLINGAGGGAGTFAVQLAKRAGAEVTGVDSARKLDLLRSIGAEHVIDYAEEDFTRNGRQYDFILDLVARRSIFDCKRALTANGIYAVVGGTMWAILQTVFLGAWFSRTGNQKLGILAVKQNTKDLETIAGLLEAGEIRAVVDRHYPLTEVAEALRYLGEGHAKGKVVITM